MQKTVVFFLAIAFSFACFNVLAQSSKPELDRIEAAGGLFFYSEQQPDKVVSIQFANDKATDETMKLVKSVNSLEGLVVNAIHVTPTGIAELKSLKNLQYLMLHRTLPDPVGAEGLSPRKAMSNLRELDISHEAVDADADWIKGMNNLVGLGLSFCPITNEALSRIKQMENIERLDLAFTQITDDGLKEIATMKNLKTLCVAGCAITDAGLSELKNLKLHSLYIGGSKITHTGLQLLRSFHDLKDLDLTGMDITDKGLGELKELSELRILRVEGGGITDVGLRELGGLKKLTTLHLVGTSVTYDGVEKLRSDLPLTDVSIQKRLKIASDD